MTRSKKSINMGRRSRKKLFCAQNIFLMQHHLVFVDMKYFFVHHHVFVETKLLFENVKFCISTEIIFRATPIFCFGHRL